MKSVPPSQLASLPNINVYFLSAHETFSQADIDTMKVWTIFDHC